ncbi:hypothetical protein LWI28_005615 [Acer negundo]|uniref:GST C-terminal domain-containing protein n=1 Tax=Acer negundo TaxID=4023 RepID=A0AAD5JF96_ACENE|nr:hypothetical protein LWI28_005615 [Acer negundo]
MPFFHHFFLGPGRVPLTPRLKAEDHGNRAWRQLDKHFYGGERIGFVDVALVPITSWFYTYETLGDFSIEVECPKFIAWSKRCLEKESVAKSLPHPHKIYEASLWFKKKNEIE